MGAAANAELRGDAGHHQQQQQQRLWRSSSDMPDANLAEEGFHDGFHQRGSGGGGGGGGADVRHDVLGGAGFSGGSGAGGSRKPVRRPSHGTLLRRVQHTNGHKHGQVSMNIHVPCRCLVNMHHMGRARTWDDGNRWAFRCIRACCMAEGAAVCTLCDTTLYSGSRVTL
jgi:hypothetical protein